MGWESSPGAALPSARYPEQEEKRRLPIRQLRREDRKAEMSDLRIQTWEGPLLNPGPTSPALLLEGLHGHLHIHVLAGAFSWGPRVPKPQGCLRKHGSNKNI